MVKIVEAIRPTAAHRLAAEQRAIADCEREIADLEQQRAAALIEDDPASALKLAERISAARRRLETHQDRVAAFQKQSRREKTDNRQRRKVEALAEFEAKFADRATAAARVDAAVAELSASLAAYRAACRLPFEKWPDVFPDRKIFESYAYSSADSAIAGALRMEARGHAPVLFGAMPQRVGRLAEKDIKAGAELVADLRDAPLPKLHDSIGEAA